MPDMIEPYIGWLVIGVALCAAEMIVPGVFLMWLGIAALLTGVAAFVLPIGLALQLGLFAILSLTCVFFGRRWSGSNVIASEDPLLNDRLGRMIGQTVVLVTAIEDGEGRVRVGDSDWPAHGPDMPVGTRARITGSRNNVLVVEALHSVVD